MTHLLLVGNPNCGKTTLFNGLTGSNQRVGNWSGVTVEKKTGEFTLGTQKIELTDLPGIYSLMAQPTGLSQDEHIAAQAIVTIDADCIINVVDACHLERHLYLTSQILELGKPVIVVLNMMDVAQQRGISIDIHALSEQLGCPIIPIQAHKGIGLSALHQILGNLPYPTVPLILPINSSTQQFLERIERQLMSKGHTAG